MTAEGRAEIREIAEKMFGAFLRMVEERHGSRPVAPGELRSALQAFTQSPPLNTLLREAHGRLLEAAALELLRQKRKDPFHRLMVHPFSDLLNHGQLSREVLPNYFSFLQLILGDARHTMAAQCTAVVAELKEPDELAFSWESFYQDPRTKQVLWAVLARIAESFKRFDVRRDWFIGLMQNRPHSVSLGPNSFLPLPRAEEPAEAVSFGVKEFTLLFECLFKPLRRLPPADQAAFRHSFGAPPEELFAALYANLAV